MWCQMDETFSARFGPAARDYTFAPNESAERALGTIEPGFRIEMVNRGQFSLIDLVRAVLAQTGPAYLTMSTWSIGRREAAAVAWMLDTDQILDLVVLMMDRGFKRLPRAWSRSDSSSHFKTLERTFGTGRILQCNSHSKFVLLVNDRYNVAIRTSANLNQNIRLEQFSIDDDRKMVEFYAGIVQSWAKVQPPGFGRKSSGVGRRFDRPDAFDDVRSLPELPEGEIDLGAVLSEAAPLDLCETALEMDWQIDG